MTVEPNPDVEERSRYEHLLERFDHFDPEFEANFVDVANELRAQCPVAHSSAYGGFWTLSRHDDVQKALSDSRRFSTVARVTIPSNPGAVPLIPLQSEPDVHRDFRRVLDPYFRAAAVERHEAEMRAIADDLIDQFIEEGRCEFIGDFAQRLPGLVIFRLLLGFPESEIEEAYRWTIALTHSLGTPEAAQVHANFLELIERMLSRRRDEPPRGDVIDALLQAEVLGRPMTEDEIQRTVLQLIAAGLDTTRRALGSMMLALTNHAALRQRLEAEPEVLPKAIEELLRYEPPATGVVRTAIADVEIDGQHIKPGDPVLLFVTAANRDPEQYDAPEQIRFDRERLKHLSFGYGAHYCIGVHLARLELRVALERLLARLHDVRIVEDHVPYDSGLTRGPTRLNLEFTPGPRSD